MSVPSSPSHEDGKDNLAIDKAVEQQRQQEQALSSEDLVIRKSYDDTKKLLETRFDLLEPVSSIVSLRNAVEDPPLDDGGTMKYPPNLSSGSDVQYGNSSNVSLLTPNRGHHTIVRALEKLEGFEKDEADLLLRTSLTAELTKIATGDEILRNPKQAIETLDALSLSVPRRVCQHPFKKNDIVWVCRTCQADETCVLCHSCFKQSNHEGHDVAFYHAQAGGCCDCGDPDAWDPAGFCPHHGPASHETYNLGPLSGNIMKRVQGVVPAILDWMVDSVALLSIQGHERVADVTPFAHHVDSISGNDIPTLSSHDTMTDSREREADAEVFSPSAAGSSRSRRELSIFPSSPVASSSSSSSASKSSQRYTKAEQLGLLAREEGGLFLILKSDDINTLPQIVDALRELFGTSSLYTESILHKVVRSLKDFGQTVCWGTMELLAELSQTQIRLWLDQDRVTSGVLGAAMLQRAQILTSHGMFCAILTRREIELEQEAVVALQWLTVLARSCDPLCQKVAESIAPTRHLVPLLQSDFKLSSRITKYWHSLLLTLLAVPTFKSHLAAAYCDTYQNVTAEYARGLGVLERSGYALSVQFLNRVTYVVDLVQRRDLLGKLGASLFQTLRVAVVPESARLTMTHGAVTRTVATQSTSNDQRLRLDPNHFVLTHRRYSPCISDLKCVLNVKGMPRLFASKSGTFLRDWIAALSLGQMMDSQIWRDWSQDHAELESRGWVGAFNASISLGSLFERLLSWDDSDPSPIQNPDSPLSGNLMSCVELTYLVMSTGLLDWQTKELEFYEATPYTTTLEPYKRSSASLPFSSLSVKSGSVLAFSAVPMSQVTPFSFHLPLHRFVAACLREASLRRSGIDDLMQLLTHNISENDRDALYLGLMEFPLIVLSRAAQLRAGLWRRNGNGLNDQVLNYAEPPFCRAMRDSDLLLVQFAILGRTRFQTTDCRPESDVGLCFMIHLFLHRLGLFEFCGLSKAPDTDINRYLDEVQKGLYRAEKTEEDMGVDFLLPFTFSPAKDASACLLLLEEFLHTMIMICCELPGLPPTDKADHTSQAKLRLRREVIHRLASGPKTHSELAEVHHVLSHWDNVHLSEEGKLVNPDDATGAALGSVLAEIATRTISRGKMEPDKWILMNEAWDSYDPSFYHINARNHQTAAESRPSPPNDTKYKVKPKPFCPPLPEAHPSFLRLRRDVTSDSTLLAIAYRTLHMHVWDSRTMKEIGLLRGSIAYDGEDRSETALARAVHLLTLGAYSWQDAFANNREWRQNGGGSIGSVFFDRSDDAPAPTSKEWIASALLANPRHQQASEWYEGQENCLQLLRRIAVDGGYDGVFTAQDKAVLAGAAWLCEFAATNNGEANKIVNLDHGEGVDAGQKRPESELDRRKRIAKEKAMERMKAQAAKFAEMMKVEVGEKNNDKKMSHHTLDETPKREVFRQGSFASGSSVASTSDSDKGIPVSPEVMNATSEQDMIPPRLLKSRPRCIICSDDGNAERFPTREEEYFRKSRRRRNDGGNALAFVGYIQASTVMKGGGGPPSSGNVYSALAPVTRFVGAHLALCGHAIHSECWESYLATVSHREERIVGKRDEFKCPLCQRLSNCLIPFIDVGIDWIDSDSNAESSAMDIAREKCEEDNIVDSMSCETLDVHRQVSLGDFLTSTPWWVSRHNKSVMWDGQCAFISEYNMHGSEVPVETVDAVSARRSVRGLRKKDLYAAWNSMMKTPRFLRRRLRQNNDTIVGGHVDVSPGPDSSGSLVSFSPSDSTGETVVWRRFMDQVSDITYRADGKRLGDENLHNDFGEFRHYIAEKYTYNLANRFAGKETTDWPSCVFSTVLSETKRQELSREKLLSKLMMSIQAFVYSTTCEVHEARRLTKQARATTQFATLPSATPDDTSIDGVFSKYGIADVVCDGNVVIMPRPNASDDEGSQPFHGRLGRLRYLGLAVMAAGGAVAADLVQLVIAFPVVRRNESASQPHRAPIAYPILYGHVLTHVVAAICATTGRARARRDALEVTWPIPFSSQGSFVVSDNESMHKNVDSVCDDSEGFIKLGLLARVLQVLLAKIDVWGLNNIAGLNTEFVVLAVLQKVRQSISSAASLGNRWTLNCIRLLEAALSRHRHGVQAPERMHAENAIFDRFQAGCLLAIKNAISFLSDSISILQLLIPGTVERFSWLEVDEGRFDEEYNIFETWSKLESLFRMESFSQMLESEIVCEIVSNWYETARSHARSANLPSAIISGSGAMVANRLYQTQGFRSYDWPMAPSHDAMKIKNRGDAMTDAQNDRIRKEVTTPMEIDHVENKVSSASAGVLAESSTPLVSFNTKRSVPLIGSFTTEVPVKNIVRPRVASIPTSYTDLYAELCQLLPDCDQTAVCLICGEVLNAGGKGECTRHSYKCGAGAGMLFLLQDCTGLIMHNGKAAYIHSPYVDSHGETPQYRGRPLNLDMDRYDHLHEVWSGHSIRQQVLAERGTSRQIIVPDFY